MKFKITLVGYHTYKYVRCIMTESEIDERLTQIANNYPASLEDSRDLLALRTDKQLFILVKWSIDYPNDRLEDYIKFTKLLEVNKSIQRWYKDAVRQFGLINEMPNWVLEDTKLRGLFGFDSSLQFELYKVKMKTIRTDREALIKKTDTEMAVINARENEINTNFIRNNPLLAINKLPVQALPLDVVLKYAQLPPDKVDESLQSELAIYKRKLAIDHFEGDLSIDDLITVLKEGQ